MLTNDYIVGLVDGEGSFSVYIKNPDEKKNRSRRVQAEPRFFLKLVEKDKDILYRLKEFFGCGNIYFQKDNRRNHQNCYRYEVSKRNDLEKIIIPFFKKNHPQFFSKKRDFEIFCEIFFRIKNGEHLEENGLRSLFKIKQLMH